jgi:polyisoprenoid-binding protein YceI
LLQACKCDARRVRLDEQNADCEVYTFKEGILSAVAHDLRLRVTRFSLETDGVSYVEGTFDARSLKVECARKGRVDDPGTLSDGDKRTIEGNIVRDVLRAEKWPDVRFRSTEVEKRGGCFHVRGELTLSGRTRTVAFDTRVEDGRQVAELVVHQPDFGIRPYRAMLGTLRVQADVRVRVAAKLP